MARPAKLFVAAVTVACPVCGEPLPSPSNGSLLWEPWQLEAQSGQTHHCPAGHPLVLRPAKERC